MLATKLHGNCPHANLTSLEHQMTAFKKPEKMPTQMCEVLQPHSWPATDHFTQMTAPDALVWLRWIWDQKNKKGPVSHPLTIHVSALQTQEDVGALGVLVPRRPTQALVLLNVHPALGVKRVLHPHILRHQPLPQLQLFPALENRKTGACVLAATAVITLDSFPQLQLFPALENRKTAACVLAATAVITLDSFPQLQLFSALENREDAAHVLAAKAVITLDSFPQLQLFSALENREDAAHVLAAKAVITLDSFPQLQLFPALKTGKMLLCTCCNSSEHTRQSSNWCDISTVVKRFRKNQSANHHNQSDSLYGHLYYY